MTINLKWQEETEQEGKTYIFHFINSKLKNADHIVMCLPFSQIVCECHSDYID